MRREELLAICKEVADNPKKQLDKYIAEGKKVIAVAPVYTPEELIHAMGFVPMGVWGADSEINEAKKYFPAFICSIMQTILELGITGAYNGVSAIVIPSLCDSLKTLGQNWKYAVKDIPFIPMNYPQNRKPDYAKDFIKAGYERVISDITKYTGVTFDIEKLKESNRIYNEHNQIMREFSDICAYADITASQRRDVFKSAWFMLKEEHTALVKELISCLKDDAPDTKSRKILISGILSDSKEFTSILDENHLRVVYDDIAHESRQYKTDIPDMDNPMDALVCKFADMDNCTLLYDRDKKRVDYIIDKAKEYKADGIIVLMTKFCDPEEFDYVPIKRACENAGIPHINIEVDRQMQHYGQARTMLQAFSEML